MRGGWRLLGDARFVWTALVLLTLPVLLRDGTLEHGLLVNDDLLVYYYLSEFGARALDATGYDLGYDTRFLAGFLQTPYFTLSTVAFKLVLAAAGDLPLRWVYFFLCLTLSLAVPAMALAFSGRMARILGYPVATANRIVLLLFALGAIRAVFMMSGMLPMYTATGMALLFYGLVATSLGREVPVAKMLLLAGILVCGTYVHVVFPLLVLPAATALLLGRETGLPRKGVLVVVTGVGLLPLFRFLAIASLSAGLATQEVAWFRIDSPLRKLLYYLDPEYVHFDTFFGLFFVIPFLFCIVDRELWKGRAARVVMLSSLYLYGLIFLPPFEPLHPMRFEPLALFLVAALFPLGFQRLARRRWVLGALLPVLALSLLIPVAIIGAYTGWMFASWELPRKAVDRLALDLEERSRRCSCRVLFEDACGHPSYKEQEWVSPHLRYNMHVPIYIALSRDVPFASGFKFDYPMCFNADGFQHGMWRGRELGVQGSEAFPRRLEQLNAGWVVAWSDTLRRYLESHPELYREEGAYGPFVLYRYRQGPDSYLMGGRGRVRREPEAVHVTRVERAEAESPLVLRFHWVEGLVGQGCDLSPWPVDGAAVPMIRLGNLSGEGCTVRFDPRLFLEKRLEAQARALREEGGPSGLARVLRAGVLRVVRFGLLGGAPVRGEPG